METFFFQNKHGTNPFDDEPLPTAHYYPSLKKDLTDSEKQINLSPKRYPKHDTIGIQPAVEVESKGRPTSPPEKAFLRKTNTLLAKELPTHDTPSPGDASSKFDESWPTSERPSTIESPGEYNRPLSAAIQPDRPRPDEGFSMYRVPSSSSSSLTGTDYLAQWRNRSKKHQGQPHKNTPAEGSTLSKYIQRFRYSEPKSRQEREQEKQANKSSDFWWLAPPSQTSTPTDDSSRASGRRRTGPGEPGARVRGRMSRDSPGSYRRTTSSASPSEKAFTDIDDLQSRADKLLERSESTILSEPAISSDGVGLSSPSSNYQEDQVYVSRNPPRPTVQESFHMPPPMGATLGPSKKTVLRPEDDILHQWRVRRRLEEARKQSSRRGPLIDVGRGAELEKQHGGSRLDDFRRRLQQQHLLSQARPGTHPTVPSEPLTKTTGTSPIPQTTATQTNGVLLPSVGEDVPVRDETIGPDDGTHREPLRTSMSHIHNLHDIYAAGHQSHRARDFESAIQREPKKPVIASPSICQTSTNKHPIPPHLHMACDIIPCPPQDTHPEEGSPPDDDSPRNHFVSVDTRRSHVSGLHRQVLRVKDQRASDAQQPAAQHPMPSREDPPSRDATQISQHHLEEDTDQGPTPPHPSAPTSSQVTKPQTVEQRLHQEAPQRVAAPKDIDPRQRLDFGQEETTRHLGGTWRSLDETMQSEASEDLPVRTGREEEKVGEEVARMDEDARPAGEGRRVSGLVHTSSPIGAAVGQVISDRLFTTPNVRPISSPYSSTDSLPSIHSSLRSHRSTGSIMVQTQPIQGQFGDEVAWSSSDGEEFADDELLQLLRRQRAQYENQLQTLDRLIQAQT